MERPSSIAGYQLIRPLGRGGMGEVFLARHPRLSRDVVIKLMKRDLAVDPVARERFLREADLASRLDHPNIVNVLDRGEDDGRLWIAMQFVPGRDAAEIARDEGPLDPDRMLGWTRQVGAALDYAHAHGIIHRDVKPANVLVLESQGRADERALVTDFGIARSMEQVTELTGAATMVGSIAYASPEQLRGDPVGPAADVYSLAATAFHLLADRPPFPGSSVTEILDRCLHDPRPVLSQVRPGIPGPVDRVMQRGLALRPDQRYPSASAFADALIQAWSSPTHAAETTWGDGASVIPLRQTDERPIAKPPSTRSGRSRTPMVAAGLLALALLGGGGAYALTHHSGDGHKTAADRPTTSGRSTTAHATSAPSQTSPATVNATSSSAAPSTSGPTLTTTTTVTPGAPTSDAPPPPATTGPRVTTTTTVTAAPLAGNGDCDEGEFCLQYNSSYLGYGSTADFTGDIADYGSRAPACVTFTGSGRGQGKCIKNNEAGYWNRSDRTVRIFYNTGYKGFSMDIRPGARGDLDGTRLLNNVASHKFL